MQPKHSGLHSWKLIEEKSFLDFPYVQVVERLCQRVDEAGKTVLDESHRFYVVKSQDWCNVIPITAEKKIVVIKQFRAGTLDFSLEFPGGVIDPEDPDRAGAALREMIEETGYEPATTPLVHLGSSRPNPALQDNFVHSFLASPVKKTRLQMLDPQESIQVTEMDFNQFFDCFDRGLFNHALMLTSMFHLLHQKGLLKSTLSQALGE